MKVKVLPLVVLVENDIGVCRGVMDDLRLAGYDVWAISTLEGVMYAIHRNKTRQIVMLVDDKFRDLIKVLKYIKTEVRHQVAVFVWGSAPSMETETMAIEINEAYDVFDKDTLGIKKLILRVRRAQKHLQERDQSRVDQMTGLPDRSSFWLTVSPQLKTSRDRGSPKLFSIVLFDADHFKRLNDAHGHVVGDTALKKTAKILKSGLRASNHLCRWGGDEFVVVMPDVSEAMASEIACGLRDKVGECRVGRNNDIPISVSFGISQILQGDIREDVEQSLTDFIELADTGPTGLQYAKRKRSA